MLINILWVAVLATAQPSDASLTLAMDQLAPAKGYVMVGLYASRDDYNSERRLRSERVAVVSNRAEITFIDLKPGEYAIKMFHDINGNGKLDTNMLGIPVEPAAFSNNAKGVMGAPSWEKAKFSLTATVTTHTLKFKQR